MPQTDKKFRNSSVIENNNDLLLDTNMLLAAVQFKAGVLEKNSFTLSSCIEELEKISKGKNKDASNARVVLKILEQNKIPVISTHKKGDAAIMDYAVRSKCSVATNDKVLIGKLKEKKVKVYRLRQKKMLVEA
ncbi:MAG: hypothetical protein HY513_02620 [Candidatus Aenigmarchaeota archaeon]|nr:hypothetical protein [Candidatus Aenigmarchaeota archaeon]